LVSLSDSENSSLESDDGDTFVSMCSTDCCGGLVAASDHLGASSADDKSLDPEEENDDDIAGRRNRPLPPRRSVSFKSVEVREYSITVGDHPLCYDGLPLTLDWEHSDTVEIRDVSTSRERRGNYRAPRRLSFDERRDRLFSVASSLASSSSPCSFSGEASSAAEIDSSPETDRSLELGLIIKMLHNSWSMNSILPPPILDDIDEDEEDEEESEETDLRHPYWLQKRRRSQRKKKPSPPPPEQVVEWKRVPFRRSNAFCE
jgi:hypothetical protein